MGIVTGDAAGCNAPRRAEILSDLGQVIAARVDCPASPLLHDLLAIKVVLLGRQMTHEGEMSMNNWPGLVQIAGAYVFAPHSYRRGLSFYHRKEWEQALELFEESAKRRPTHAASHFKAGMCEYRLEQFYRASQRIEHALALDPSMKKWRTQLGQAKARLGRLGGRLFDEEEAALRLRVSIDPNNAAAHNRLAHLLRQRGQWWLVVESLMDAIRLDDRHATWHFRLGEALQELRRFNEAQYAYEHAIGTKRKESSAEWYYRLGLCRQYSAKAGVCVYPTTYDAYEKAIARDTKLSAHRFGIGVFHQAASSWNLAIDAYSARLELRPEDADLNYRLGMAYDRTYDWSRAEHCYRAALQCGSSNSQWSFRLGLVRERQQDFEGAAHAYRAALSNTSKHVRYWYYRLGTVLAQGGQIADSVQAFVGMKFWPGGAQIFRRLGGRDMGTIAEQLKALKLQSDSEGVQVRKPAALMGRLISECGELVHSAAAWNTLGGALEDAAEWGLAATAYRQACDRSDDLSFDYQYRLGYTLHKSGNDVEALEAFQGCRRYRTAHGIQESTYTSNVRQKQLAHYAEEYERSPLVPRTVLFESFNGSSLTCNPYALFLEMTADPTFDEWTFIWVLNDKSKIPGGLRHKVNVVFISKNSDAYIRYLCSTKYLVNNSGFPPYFIRKTDQKYLATWHGTPLKTLGKEQKYKFFDHKRTQRNFLQSTHIISPNRHTSEILLDSYDIRNCFSGKLAETGYPRIDRTLNASSEHQANILTLLDLAPDVPVVLYAPTWRGTLQEANLDADRLVDDLKRLSTQDCQVVFRGHSLLEEQVKGLELECKLVPEDIDSNELLSIVDILITDYSSIFFDFIPLNRPIIYYAYDVEEYETERGLYFDIREMPGSHCFSIDSVCDAIQNTLSKPGLALQGYDSAHQRFNPFDDGRAAQRTLEFFLSDSDENVLPHSPESARENIVIYPGATEPNGITTSLQNLLSQIDRAKVNPIIGFSPNDVELKDENMQGFSTLDRSLDFIPRYGHMLMSLEERYLESRARKFRGSGLSSEMKNILTRMYAREFVRIFGDSSIDSVVHFSGYNAFWAQLFAAASGVKKFIYLHNDLYSEHLAKYPYLAQTFRSYRHYDGLVSVSEGTSTLNRNNLAERFSIEGNRFVYCDNLQNPSRVLQAANESPSDEETAFLANSETVFFTMGRMSPEKDHLKLIRSFSRVYSEFPMARLILLGTGPLHRQIEMAVSELGLVDAVYMPGRLSNPFRLLARSDCFVMPSNYEGQPMVLFEAMILNKQIVATDIVGNRSAIEGRSGCLVENTDDALFAGMCDFINGKLELKVFDVEAYQQQALEMFYEKVCALRGH